MLVTIIKNGIAIGNFDPETRPQRSQEFLRIGQKVFNWANGVGEFPSVEEIKFAKCEVIEEDITARARRK